MPTAYVEPAVRLGYDGPMSPAQRTARVKQLAADLGFDRAAVAPAEPIARADFVRQWLEKHPRVSFHFVPTSASWLNLVERFFAELTTRRLKRLAVTSVDELVDAISRYIESRNQRPRPFVWTAATETIIAKVNKAKETLATHH